MNSRAVNTILSSIQAFSNVTSQNKRTTYLTISGQRKQTYFNNVVSILSCVLILSSW